MGKKGGIKLKLIKFISVFTLYKDVHLSFGCRSGSRLRLLPAMQHAHWHASRSSRTLCPSVISHGTWRGLGGSWKSTRRSRKGPLRRRWRSWTGRDGGCSKGCRRKRQVEELTARAATVTAQVELAGIPTTIITGSRHMWTRTTSWPKLPVYWTSCTGLGKTSSSCGTWGSWSWTSVSSCVCSSRTQKRSGSQSILLSALIKW